MIEAVVVTVAGALAGVVLLAVLTALLAPFAAAHYGLLVQPGFVAGPELLLLAAVVAVGVLASMWPGYRAYKLSLADGLTPRV
jgi:putative ABC transport system permease protein